MQPTAPLTTPGEEPADPSAWAALARGLRATTDAVLVLCALAGVIGLAGLGVLGMHRVAWLAPLIATGAAGAWGMADRELREREARGAHGVVVHALHVARWCSAAIGAAAALLFAGAVVAVLFGDVIS